MSDNWPLHSGVGETGAVCGRVEKPRSASPPAERASSPWWSFEKSGPADFFFPGETKSRILI